MSDRENELNIGPELGIDCERALELLPRYGDGELTDHQGGILRHHLMACPPCRSVASEQRGLVRWFEPTAPIAVPDGFAARVAAAAFEGGELADAPVEESLPIRSMAPTGGPRPLREAGGVRDFVLFLTAAAAVALFALSVAIGLREKPAEETLSATEVTEVLRLLDANRAALEAESSVGAGRTSGSPGSQR